MLGFQRCLSYIRKIMTNNESLTWTIRVRHNFVFVCVCVCVSMCVCVCNIRLINCLSTPIYLRLLLSLSSCPCLYPSYTPTPILPCYTPTTAHHQFQVPNFIQSRPSCCAPLYLATPGREQCHHRPSVSSGCCQMRTPFL